MCFHYHCAHLQFLPFGLERGCLVKLRDQRFKAKLYNNVNLEAASPTVTVRKREKVERESLCVLFQIVYKKEH